MNGHLTLVAPNTGNQWREPNVERELAHVMLKRSLLTLNGNITALTRKGVRVALAPFGYTYWTYGAIDDLVERGRFSFRQKLNKLTSGGKRTVPFPPK